MQCWVNRLISKPTSQGKVTNWPDCIAALQMDIELINGKGLTSARTQVCTFCQLIWFSPILRRARTFLVPSLWTEVLESGEKVVQASDPHTEYQSVAAPFMSFAESPTKSDPWNPHFCTASATALDALKQISPLTLAFTGLNCRLMLWLVQLRPFQAARSACTRPGEDTVWRFSELGGCCSQSQSRVIFRICTCLKLFMLHTLCW